MKKLIIIRLILSICTIYGCWKDKTTIDDTNRKSENWLSINDSFSEQIKNSPFILNLNNFFQTLYTENEEKSNITTEINAKFDEKSTLQWWFYFLKDKYSIWKDENSEITFDITAISTQDKKNPFETSWSLSLLYKNQEAYIQLHRFWLFMWEENVNTKMYSLLIDLIRDKRVNLEIHGNWLVKIDEKSAPQKLPENLQKIITSNEEWNLEMLSNLSEFIETLNWYINLWISTKNLSINYSWETLYSELSNWIIQKEYTWHFKWDESIFDFSFSANKKWLNIKIFNIKSKNDENFEDLDSDFYLFIEETSKWKYEFDLDIFKLKQKVLDCKWNIEYWDIVKISWIFILEPIELINDQKFSWRFTWKISQNSWDNLNLPELTWNILLLNELLNSL